MSLLTLLVPYIFLVLLLKEVIVLIINKLKK